MDTAAERIRGFGEILTDRLGAMLPSWIDAVEASQLPGLTGFACHLRRDVDAVTAGLTLHSITSRKAFARAAVQMMRWHDDQPR
ncbi:hypothetical protein [Streptomyces decoyicus]|uniref:hypothetical protein n=1 Tax=Streptomyces decoyicus TaxID=249567 RepID=UPI0033AFCDF0